MNFPEEIVRACCPGKSCSNVTLTFEMDALLEGGVAYAVAGYKRDNGDWYWGLGPFKTAGELERALAEPYELNAS
jgi:hypothetical protein